MDQLPMLMLFQNHYRKVLKQKRVEKYTLVINCELKYVYHKGFEADNAASFDT